MREAPKLVLDLFCGAGGAAMGLHRAWPEAEIVGVDIKPQPHYPFHFVQADAMTFPLNGFDFIWASPPCQGYTLMRHMGKRAGEGAPRLIDPVRRRIRNFLHVIENVVGSPLIDPITLCGSMFNLGVRRHRLFESSFFIDDLECRHNGDWPIAVWGDGRLSRQEVRRQHRGPIAVYGDHPEDSAIHRQKDDRPGLTRRAATLEVGSKAMGIDWMEWKELTQAIPPAYSQYIAEQYLKGDA